MFFQIVHIDGAFDKYKNATLSSGTTQFDLTVISNTVVRLLKASPGYTLSQNKSVCIPESTIENAVKYEGMIRKYSYNNQFFLIYITCQVFIIIFIL